MIEFGYFSFALAFIFSIYVFLTSVYAIAKPHQGVLLSASRALHGVTICLTISSAILVHSLVTHDFSVRYVYENSAVDMPIYYLVTSFWGSQAGSHLIWALILALLMSLSLLTLRNKNKELLPGILFSYAIVMIYMTAVCLWISEPLERGFPFQRYGNGLNALLQNPYMGIHPPILFTGYSGLVVPFAYALAALIRGGFTTEWAKSIRRWSLVTWIFLTVGIFLGGKWAYVELGWAGYWAWDPVENVSFMPWLGATAALHSLLILDKIQRLPRLTLVLYIISFILTFFGTMVVRSGLINSVHSFADGNLGLAYTSFLGVLTLVSLMLLALRGHKLQGAAQSNVWTLSKETGLLFTNYFLIFFLAFVMAGTMRPVFTAIFTELRVDSEPAFFNRVAPFIGIALVSIVGFGNLLRWKGGKIADPILTVLLPAIWTIPITYIVYFKGHLSVGDGIIKWNTISDAVGYFFSRQFHKIAFDGTLINIVIFSLCIWSTLVLTMDLVMRLKDLRWNGKLLFKFNRPYLGSWLVHVGFLISVIGFLGGYRGQDVTVLLEKDQKVEYYGHTFTNKGVDFQQESNVIYIKGNVGTKNEQTGEEFEIHPLRSKYTNSEQLLSEIGIHSTMWYDIYIILQSFDQKTQQVSLKIHINPTVKLVWTSLVIMVLGALLGLSHFLRKRSVDINAAGATTNDDNLTERLVNDMGGTLALPQAKLSEEDEFRKKHRLPASVDIEKEKSRPVTSFVILALSVVTLIFGFSPVVFGQDHEQKASETGVVFELDPEIKDVAKEFRCPTCRSGISIIESNTYQSQAMVKQVIEFVKEGKSKDEIVDYFTNSYGEFILLAPTGKSTGGFLIWVIPALAFVLGPIFLIISLARSRKRLSGEQETIGSAIDDFIKAMKKGEEV